MDDAMHGEHVVLTIHGIENAPVADRILGHTGQIRRNGLMAKIRDVRRQPFSLVEQSLGELFLERHQIRDATCRILEQPCYRQRAMRLAREGADRPGLPHALDLLEGLARTTACQAR